MKALAVSLACALALAPGCSFLTVRGAPSNDPGVRPVDCTQSRFAPIVDTVPAVVLLGIAAAVLADVSDNSESEAGSTLAGGLVIVVFGIPGVPFGLSAWYGYHKTGKCRAMNRRPIPQPPAPLIPSAQPPGMSP